MVAGRPRETVAEIAARTGRALTTVRNTWTRHPDWPAPVGRRGRWAEYDPADVDAFVHAHVARRHSPLEPDRLYTAQELETAGIGITASTIRSRRSRGRWPEPDRTEGDTHMWLGRTATAAIANRYRRT